MPKFKLRQQKQKKLQRHNPVARADPATQSARTPKVSSDALPILSSLPFARLAPGAASSLQEDEQIHRSLLGLNSLLLSKASRAALLNPKHKLIHRLTNLLDHRRLEIRKEAAGCLRNLCVEGQWSICEQLWQLGGGVTALAQVKYAATELGLLPKQGQSADVTTSNGPMPAAQAGKKPEDMNRKERRHAAKAARGAGVKGGNAIGPAITLVNATPASALAEIEAHELLLLHYSLLENHLTILWCLLEGVESPTWINTLNRSEIGSLLTPCVAEGVKAFVSPLAGNTILQKEEIKIRAAKVEVALTAANLLTAWLEENSAAAASIAGLPLELVEQVAAFEQARNRSAAGTKSRLRLEAILERFGFIDSTKRREASAPISSLAHAVEALVAESSTEPTAAGPTLPAALQGERMTLGLLSLASMSNLVSSLPMTLRAWIPTPDSSNLSTISQWLATKAAPRLTTLISTQGRNTAFWEAVRSSQEKRPAKERRNLAEASGMDVDVERVGNEDEESLRPSLTLRRLDDLQLAMELLGEICTGADIEEDFLVPAFDEGARKSGAANGADEDHMDEDGDANDEDSLSTGKEEDMPSLSDADRSDDDDADDKTASAAARAEGAAGSDVEGNSSMVTIAANTSKRDRKTAGDLACPSSAYAQLVTRHNLPGLLLNVAQSAAAVDGNQAISSCPSFDFVLATHRTIAALLSGLASHAKPPPSHPLKTGSNQARKVAQFQRWVKSEPEQWQAAWTALKPWAAVSRNDAAGEPLATPVWSGLHALLVMHEGVDPLPFEVASEELKALFGSSLDVALARSGGLTASSMAHDVEAATDAATTACLIVSSLAYLARSASAGAVLEERNLFAVDLWLTLLSSAPTVSAPVVISTLNSLVDTYADETALWDQMVFRASDVLGRLNSGSVVAKVKERAKTVDKRRQTDVREALDEAIENLIAFMEYRQSLLAVR